MTNVITDCQPYPVLIDDCPPDSEVLHLKAVNNYGNSSFRRQLLVVLRLSEASDTFYFSAISWEHNLLSCSLTS